MCVSVISVMEHVWWIGQGVTDPSQVWIDTRSIFYWVKSIYGIIQTGEALVAVVTVAVQCENSGY